MKKLSLFIIITAFSLLICVNVNAQDYDFFIEKADSCYKAKNLSAAITFYKKAEKMQHLEKMHLLDAAITAAEAQKMALAFKWLDCLVDKDWAIPSSLADETAFKPLMQSKKWQKLYDKAVQIEKDYLPIRTLLEQIHDEDQLYRTDTASFFKQYGSIYASFTIRNDYWKGMRIIDSLHYLQIVPIVEKHGWVSLWTTSQKASSGLFLVIQHNINLDVQKKYLPQIKDAGMRGIARKSDAALLEDRILNREHKPQIYGTQYDYDAKKGYYVIEPVQDRSKVNALRKKVGLKPIEYDMAKRNMKWE